MKIYNRGNDTFECVITEEELKIFDTTPQDFVGFPSIKKENAIALVKSTVQDICNTFFRGIVEVEILLKIRETDISICVKNKGDITQEEIFRRGIKNISDEDIEEDDEEEDICFYDEDPFEFDIADEEFGCIFCSTNRENIIKFCKFLNCSGYINGDLIKRKDEYLLYVRDISNEDEMTKITNIAVEEYRLEYYPNYYTDMLLAYADDKKQFLIKKDAIKLLGE